MGQQMEFYFFFSFPFLSLKMHFRFFSLLIKILLTFNKSGLVSFYVFCHQHLVYTVISCLEKNPSSGHTCNLEKSAHFLENWIKFITFFARLRVFFF